MPVYDSYSAVQRLMQAGLSEEQAAAIVREQFSFVENLATKDDVAGLRRDMATKDDLKAVDAKFAVLEANLRRDMEAMEKRLQRFYTGLAFAMTGAIAAIVKLL
jgi:hypothetical protein